MTFTGRIRGYLLLVAILPPALVMSVVYLYSSRQATAASRQEAQHSLERFRRFEQAYISGLERSVTEIGNSTTVRQALRSIRSHRNQAVDLAPVTIGVDFLEILDTAFTVVASSHRPGMTGEKAPEEKRLSGSTGLRSLRTVEYDIEGPHAAYAVLAPIADGYLLYSGRYISDSYRLMVSELIGAPIRLIPSDSADIAMARMEVGQLYSRHDSLSAVVSGGPNAGFYLVADFTGSTGHPILQSMLGVTGAVALVSILLAVALGLYITHRAKREIDNLVSATARVAEGNFGTPVMAYEEGEFSQLADSFSEMMVRLKALQTKLGTTEKIAAWQAMGRKIAHEVKNPLTPIAISIDDLRRSHAEQQPDFDRILLNTTATIKAEVARLNDMLDQFVRFARMKPPVISQFSPERLLDKIRNLYGAELENGRLRLINDSRRRTIAVDPEQMQQLLINLIKNSLETGPETSVRVKLTDEPEDILLRVEDTGPGFADDVIGANFQPYLSKKAGGSGLGLVICQRIVFDHGGTIGLYNRDSGGAGVVIALPAGSE